jgi:hypothetical protein
MVRKLFVTMLVATVAALAATTSATAARQTGLVNVNVEDNTVQVPIAIAANVCDVTVAALVSELTDTGTATCTALAASGATVTPSAPGPETRQNGLINVNLENNTVQVPIAAAVNICDVDVLVLVTAILLDDATSCTANAGAAGIA